MKLEATILPRRDGKVSATVGGATYEFALDDDGRLVGEVGNADHVRHLLQTENFIPADEADYDSAAALIGAPDLDGVMDMQETPDDTAAGEVDQAGEVAVEAPRRGRPRKAG